MEIMTMVSLDVYEEYAHHHKQSLMKAAQMSKELRQKKHLTRSTSQNLFAFFAWLQKSLFSDTRSDSGQTRDRVNEERNMTMG
jgi:hypothetical protein